MDRFSIEEFGINEPVSNFARGIEFVVVGAPEMADITLLVGTTVERAVLEEVELNFHLQIYPVVSENHVLGTTQGFSKGRVALRPVVQDFPFAFEGFFRCMPKAILRHVIFEKHVVVALVIGLKESLDVRRRSDPDFFHSFT
jgi:hypothetical protein